MNFELSVSYPVTGVFGTANEIETKDAQVAAIVGKQSVSSGCGFGGRDQQFRFADLNEGAEVRRKLEAAGFTARLYEL